MNKINKYISIFFLVFITSFMSSNNVYAYSCLMLASEIEEKIANLDQTEYAFIINTANLLKEEGIGQHDNGDHTKSEDLLNAALRLLDI